MNTFFKTEFTWNANQSSSFEISAVFKVWYQNASSNCYDNVWYWLLRLRNKRKIRIVYNSCKIISKEVKNMSNTTQCPVFLLPHIITSANFLKGNEKIKTWFNLWRIYTIYNKRKLLLYDFAFTLCSYLLKICLFC